MIDIDAGVCRAMKFSFGDAMMTTSSMFITLAESGVSCRLAALNDMDIAMQTAADRLVLSFIYVLFGAKLVFTPEVAYSHS